MSYRPCTEGCAPHGGLCEHPAGHPGDHECHDCPGHLARQRAQMIADRVAAHKATRDLTIAPDED